MLIDTENQTIVSIVGQVFAIESITWGDAKSNYTAQFRGHLISEDTEACYDQLAAALRPLDITPLFRIEKGQQVVVLMKGVINPKPSRIWINILMFALTVVSVFIVGFMVAPTSADQPTNLGQYIQQNIGGALAFAVSLLAILVTHEFGHYLMSRYHKTAATLPYFIPLPLPPLGTMGAVIIQKEPHKNKRILLDIGMAGPMAGLIVAIPVLLIGLALSKVEAIPAVLAQGEAFSLEGNSILYLLAKFVVFHQWLPAPASYGNLPPILYWIRFFFTSLPAPLGGQDVMISPVAYAGWAGLLLTGINLIPAGQLDGGHILSSLVGRRAAWLLPFIVIGIGLLGFVFTGWWLWVVLILLLGRVYAEPLDQITPLDNRRKILAVIGLIVFILVFIPVPWREFF